MGEEAIRIAIFSSGFLGVIAMAFAMGLKSKWARGDSTEMNPEGKQTQIEAIEKAIREGKYTNLSDAFLTGGLSKAQSIFGGILSTFATVFVSMSLVLACCAML